MPTILIADDQPDIIEALRLLLKGAGFQIETARSVAGILAAVESQALDAVVMDLNYTRDTTSGREGLNAVQRIRELDDALPIIVMTAWGSVAVLWKRFGREHRITSKSRGTIRGCSRLSRRRSSLGAPSVPVASSSGRIAHSNARGCRI